MSRREDFRRVSLRYLNPTARDRKLMNQIAGERHFTSERKGKKGLQVTYVTRSFGRGVVREKVERVEGYLKKNPP